MLGAVVVLTTSTLNRVMVVELALPAMLPGLLVALHYAVQTSRPRMGFGSDIGGRRTPWIVGGMVVLAPGRPGRRRGHGVDGQRPHGAASRWPCCRSPWSGWGVSAGGTSLLVLLAKRVRRRPSRPGGHAGVGDDDRRLRRHRRPGRAAVWTRIRPSGWCWSRRSSRALAVMVTLAALAGIEGRGDRRCGSGGQAEGRAVPSGPGAGLARTRGAALHDLRLRLDAGLQRAGPDPGALRRLGVRLHAGRVDTSSRACSMAACCSACCWSRWPARRIVGGGFGSLRHWTVGRLHRLGRGAARPGRWPACWPALAAAAECLRARRRPTAPLRLRRSAR